MNLKLKYEFNDEVYAVYKNNYRNEVVVTKGIISEFSMSKEDGLFYYLDNGDDFKEENLIPLTRHDLLAARIDELLKEKE